MKKLSNIFLVFFLFLITSAIYFQSWFGPFKNWVQIKEIAIYPQTNNEMWRADLNSFLNDNGHWLSANTAQIELNHFAASQHSIVYQGFIKLLASATQQPQLAINLFDYLGYLLLVIVSFYVLRKLQINKGIAFVFALLYCFSFYHQNQSTQITMGWYFVVPIYCYWIFKILAEAGKSDQPLMQHFLNKKSTVLCAWLMAVLLPFLGISYALIGTILLLASLLIFLSSSPSLRKKALIFGLVYGLLSIVSTVWVLELNQQLLGQSAGYYPTIAEVEQSSFKYTQLLLPNPFHRIQSLSILAHEYFSLFPNTEANLLQLLPVNGDNTYSSLGLLASLGMVAIILLAIFSVFQNFQASRTAKLHSNTLVEISTTIFPALVILLLFGGYGAFSSVLAWFTQTIVVEWYRASTFISFYALFFMAASVQLLFAQFKNKPLRSPLLKNSIYFLVLVLIAFVGLFDQVPSHCGQCRSNKESVVKEQFQAIQAIPNSVAKKGAWLQLPQPILFQTSPSSLNFLTLENTFLQHQKLNQLDLSDQHAWQRLARTLPLLEVSDQVILAKYLQYQGLLINTNNWCNWPSEKEKVVKELVQMKVPEATNILQPTGKTNSYLPIELVGQLSFEQIQRATEVLKKWGFSYTNNQLKNEFDYSQPMNFAVKQMPSYVKNMTGLLGDKVRLRGMDPYQDQCFYSATQAPTGLKKPDYLYGELFLNPIINHEISIQLQEDLPVSFDLVLDMSWRQATSANLENTATELDEAEVVIQAKNQIQKIKLNANSQPTIIRFNDRPINKNSSANDIILIKSNKPVATFNTVNKTNDLSGVVVLKAIAIKMNSK